MICVEAVSISAASADSACTGKTVSNFAGARFTQICVVQFIARFALRAVGSIVIADEAVGVAAVAVDTRQLVGG